MQSISSLQVHELVSTYGRVVKAVCKIIGVPDIPMGPEMIL